MSALGALRRINWQAGHENSRTPRSTPSAMRNSRTLNFACSTDLIQSKFHREAVFTIQSSGDLSRSESTSGGRRPSGGSVLWNPLDFPDNTGSHVENKASHRNLFGDPRM
jgi:hypothetical protein